MSMLAGPRRKQRVINLRAKNNEWSNDSTKFGQKMLEKMGWSSGKGLGAKENGIVEHVVARYKNDDRGLGFEDKNDQWTKHEDDFNALLANLSNDTSTEEKLHSGISLEDKSKKSKARVHYHKFTRGKDLSRYSEKDLANIFGKKTFKEETPVENIEKEDVKITEQKFTEKGSMEDYFKNKLASLKSKSSFLQPRTDNDCDNDDADYSFKGFSGTADDDNEEAPQGLGFQSFSFYNTETSKPEQSETALEVSQSEHNVKKKKKKSSKRDQSSEQPEDTSQAESEHVSDEPQQGSSKKSKKSKKHKLEAPIAPESVENIVPESKKCKKKRKHSNEEDTQEQPQLVESDHIHKKKKKKKHV
ncbi:hypothetical protein JYU34_005047 [Plutella xylostella]|uniref:G-patch domain-containing protein n=1 Tax=Plutella xylostella TaxID=51655 RepID=A0ABQ7QVQ2_PLUXY|nr:hypothetical protein JYU34_005047 [Plutella xylostella]